MDYKVKPEEAGRKVRDILRRSMGVSYSAMKSAKWNGRIRLNGETAHADAVVAAGDLVSMEWAEDAPVYEIKPFELQLEIPYLDEDVMAVVKPAGIAVQSSRNHPDDSLENAVYAWLGCPEPASNYVVIQRNQMVYRPLFALCFGAMIFFAPKAFQPIRFLLGNPVARFLSGISMNFYLIHQTIIVHMKRLGFPPSVSEYPNQAGEQPWQTRYTLLAFGLSFAAAVLITYLVEKPSARLINRIRKKGPAQRQGG